MYLRAKVYQYHQILFWPLNVPKVGICAMIDPFTRYKIQDTRNFISCRLRLTNNISSELFSDKQSKNETNVKRLQ